MGRIKDKIGISDSLEIIMRDKDGNIVCINPHKRSLWKKIINFLRGK